MKDLATQRLFDKTHSPQHTFKELVDNRMKSGDWTAEELAMSLKNNWLEGQDARYTDILRDVLEVMSTVEAR